MNRNFSGMFALTPTLSPRRGRRIVPFSALFGAIRRLAPLKAACRRLAVPPSSKALWRTRAGRGTIKNPEPMR